MMQLEVGNTHHRIRILMHKQKARLMTYAPVDTILVYITLASYEGSGKSAHMPRLIRAFAASMQKLCM